MKPHLRKTRSGDWGCYTPNNESRHHAARTGSIGRGPTPHAAYRDWRRVNFAPIPPYRRNPRGNGHLWAVVVFIALGALFFV